MFSKLRKLRLISLPLNLTEKLRGMDRTEDNLTDETYIGYKLTTYFDEFDFRGS